MVQVSEEMLRDLRITTSTVEQHRGGEASSLLGELGVNRNAYAEVSAPLPERVVSLGALDRKRGLNTERIIPTREVQEAENENIDI